MPDPLSQLQKLTNFLDKSVEDFSKDLPGVQDKIFDRVQVLLKELELSRGSVKASVKNLRKINRIKREIEDIVYSAKYFKDVDYFTNAFDISTDLQTGYFQTMEKNFTTPKFIEVLKKSTMESTKVALTEAGIQANVVDKAAEIIQTNISQGRKFGNMVTDMRNFLVTTPEHVGALKSYASHIVRDSINTYAAQYNQYVSDDLDLQWFVYTGALVKTSRSFCVKLVKKQYVHKSEFGKVAAGNFIPKPLDMKGLKPDTKASNLQILRGGYNCNHLLSPIGEAWVPKKLRAKFAKGTKETEATPPVAPPKPKKEFKPAKTIAEAERFAKNNLIDIKNVSYKGMDIKEVNLINEELISLQGKYGKLGTMENIRTSSKKFTARMAYGRDLELNPKYMKSGWIKRSVEAGIDKMKPSVQGIIDHEIGHTLTPDIFDISVKPSVRTEFGKDLLKFFNTNRARIKEELTDYAATAPHEFTAEAFAAREAGLAPKWVLKFLKQHKI